MNIASPFVTTYWVEPGFFLAGAHPIAISKRLTLQQALQKLLAIPLVTFIDLTTPQETQSYETIAHEEAIKLGQDIIYRRLAIGDDGIPTVTQMQYILDVIDASLDSQQGVYVHCFSGVGRTGTVVGCYLVRHGVPSNTVLDRLAQLREETLDAGLIAPRTAEQRAFIQAWTQGL